MSDDASKKKPKIGAGHLNGMARLGLAELRASMYPQSNVAQAHAPYGVWGIKTPGEVMQDKGNETRDPNEQPSVLNERLMQVEQTLAEKSLQHEHEPPNHALEPENEPEIEHD